MGNDHKSAREIEVDIEQERAQLARTLDALSHKLSIDGLVGQVSDSVRRNGNDMGRAVGTAVKDNPLAVALTAAGLAWLFGGQTVREKASELRGPSTAEPARLRSHPYPAPGHAEPHFDRPPSARLEQTQWDPQRPSGATASHKTDGLGSRIADTAASVRDSVTSAASSARDAVTSAAHSAAEGTKSRAEWLRESLSFGTEDLSEGARERVIAARQKAVEFKAYANRKAHNGASQTRDFVENHPLVAGAALLAVGAAIAASLPRTRIEDEEFGRYSDDLIADAERVAREEAYRARVAAGHIVDEAEAIAKETAQDAKKTVSDTVQDVKKSAPSAHDVAEAAKAKAGEKVVETEKRLSDAASTGTASFNGNNPRI